MIVELSAIPLVLFSESLSPELSRVAIVGAVLLTFIVMGYAIRNRLSPIFVATPFLLFPLLDTFLTSEFFSGPLRQGFFTSDVLTQESADQAVHGFQYIGPHSSFIGIPYVLYSILALTGLRASFAPWVLAVLTDLSAGLFAYVAARVVAVKTSKPLIVYSMFLALTVMSYAGETYSFDFPSGYNGAGLFMMLLLVTFLWSRGDSASRIVTFILAFGITLTSPYATIIVTFIFLWLAVLTRKAVYLVIPMLSASYLVYSAYLYLATYGYYVRNALQGVSAFLSELLSGTLHSGVVPGTFPSETTALDLYVNTLTLFAGLVVASVLSVLVVWRHKSRKDSVATSVALASLTLIVAGAAVYLGGSSRASGFTSDTRTFLFAWAVFVSPLCLLQSRIEGLGRLKFKRYLVFVLIILVVAAQSGLYSVYPHSFSDPATVVEDPRLSLPWQGAVADFLTTNVHSGAVVGDRSALYQIPELFFSLEPSITFEILTSAPSSFATPTVVVFNSDGNSVRSLYTSPQFYREAASQANESDVVYRAGPIVVYFIS
jgi:hypothetical protein